MALALASACQTAERGPGGGAAERERAAELREMPLALAPRDRLRIIGFDGDLRIEARASGTPTLFAHLGMVASTQSRAEAMLGYVSVGIERKDGWLELRLHRPDGLSSPFVTNSSYDLYVPEGIRLHVVEGVAGVTAHGPLGPVSVTTTFGEVALRDVRGETWVEVGTGHVTLENVHGRRVVANPFHGNVHAVGIEADLLVFRSRDGEVAIRDSVARTAVIAADFGSIEVERWRGNLEARTASGSVELGQAEGKEFSLYSGWGDVEVRDTVGFLTATAPRGSVTVRGFEGGLSTSSTSGEVLIEARLRELRVEVSSGDVTASILPGSRMGAPWLVSARMGDVDVALPADLGCDLDARTSFGTVTSHVPMLIEASQRTDNKRLRGDLNEGGRRLLIETSVGDVTVRPFGAR